MDGAVKRPKAARKKKKANECPNPLFLKWLERWRDEAEAKESKMQYVYSKAISSLKKYPLPLESGKEAMILYGIGASIAKRLDDELEKHNRDLENNDTPDDDIPDVAFPDLRVPCPPNITTSPTINDTPKDSIEPTAKKKRKSSPREYVPMYRSGPYAILMALQKASERIGYKGYMTKTELQDQAQPYTDTSFTVPEPDSYYTAWSSMSTLIRKGLIKKAGNPARFCLTDSGQLLADKLITVTAEQNNPMRSPSTSQSPPPLPSYPSSPPSTSGQHTISKHQTHTTLSPTICSPPRVSLIAGNSSENKMISTRTKPLQDVLASYKTPGTEVMPFQVGSLKFWYVGSDGECVDHQDKAAVIVDDEIQFGYLIKCQQSELDWANVKYKLDHSRTGKDGHVFVYVSGECVAEQRPLTKKCSDVKKTSDVKPHEISIVSDDSDDEMLMRPLFERLAGDRHNSEITSEITLGVTSGITSEITARTVRTGLQESSATTSVDMSDVPSDITECSLPSVPAASKPSRTVSNTNPCSSRTTSTIMSDEKTIVPEYELKAGSFEIILCVDYIETTGGAKTVRKGEMVKELRMNGVDFDVRKLNVGDFLWVAREKVSPIPGQLVLPERRELVLGYIVERKRMDDLCSSIKDGRFKEQKFRLLNSGLRHPIYLVEDFGSMNFMSMPAQTLEQAIINTQVGQDFFVKRTRDVKESAAYLTLMTRYLRTVFENRTLRAIKRDDMDYIKVDDEQVNTFLMTFQELNDISIKNRVLTVGELFGKQLLQIPGVAAEKVVGILEHYPTLRDLLDAYEELESEKEKENLLADLKFGKTQRKVGPTVSKTVYQLYCTKGALS